VKSQVQVAVRAVGPLLGSIRMLTVSPAPTEMVVAPELPVVALLPDMEHAKTVAL
jgi:hypothetical protein